MFYKVLSFSINPAIIIAGFLLVFNEALWVEGRWNFGVVHVGQLLVDFSLVYRISVVPK